ncbi:MAG: ABC transporter permease [Planctomycetaceae bacterium]
MTFRDLVGSACTGLRQQKLRTLLTISGVALGAMLLFCSIAGGLGVLNALNNRLSIGDRLLQIRVSRGFLPPKEDVEAVYRDQIPKQVSAERRDRLAKLMAMRSASQGSPVPLRLKDAMSLAEIDGVQHVTPKLSWQSLVEKDGNDWRAAQIRAIQATDKSVNGLIVMGRALASNSAKEVLVNEAFLFAAGIYTDEALRSILDSELTIKHRGKPGQMSVAQLTQCRDAIAVREQLLQNVELSVSQRSRVEAEVRDFKKRIDSHAQAIESSREVVRVKVVGIYKSPDEQGFQADGSLVDAFYTNLLLPVGTAAECWSQFSPSDRSVTATVKAKDSQSAKRIVAGLKERGLTCTSLADLALRIRSAVLMVSAIVTAIAAAAFLISALGMTNTMVMNVLERRREIGILKSIGAKDRDILQMFLAEGLIVGVTGGLLGLGLGIMVSAVSSDYIRQFLERRLDESISDSLFAYPVWLIIGTPVLAGLVTVAASLIPARQASRLDPVQTLRAL